MPLHRVECDEHFRATLLRDAPELSDKGGGECFNKRQESIGQFAAGEGEWKNDEEGAERIALCLVSCQLIYSSNLNTQSTPNFNN